MIKLYDLAAKNTEIRFSPYCWLVKIVFHYKGIEFDTIPCHFTEKKKLPVPNEGKVPVITNGKDVVNDSWKIVKYIEQNYSNNVVLDKTIIALFAKDDDEKTTKQFLNTYELGIYNLGISDVVIKIEFFENENDLKKIIEKNLLPGKIFLGPIQFKYAKILDNYCTQEVIFFSYSSESSLAKDC